MIEAEYKEQIWRSHFNFAACGDPWRHFRAQQMGLPVPPGAVPRLTQLPGATKLASKVAGRLQRRSWARSQLAPVQLAPVRRGGY